jgi:hypothetical protein
MGAAPARGAHGLRLTGLDSASDLLVAPAPRWHGLHIERRAGERPAIDRIGVDAARIALHGSGSIGIDRASATVTVTAPEPPGDREFVHPYLGAVAAVVTRWLGHNSLHAGAVLVDGEVWGLLGVREGGKSTLLAGLALAGLPVMSDDLLVMREGTAFAGPRCVDLRADAAQALGVGEAIGVVGARERWRLTLDPAPPEAPAGGWVVLEWGEAPAVERVAPAERLPRLLEHATIVPEPPDPAGLLGLAALPMLRLVRPRGLAALGDVSDLLLEAVAAARTTSA